MGIIVQDLRSILGVKGIEAATFVPVPPSKAEDDPQYDPRLAAVLNKLAAGLDADIRALVKQRASMDASHESERRATIDELIAEYGPNLHYTPPGGWGASGEVDRLVKTHCCFCGVQCGIQLKVSGDQVVGFEPW